MALDKLTKLTSQSGITTTIDYQMSDLTVDTITVQSGGIKMPVGMSTFQNINVTGNLTVNGTTTTLDTDLIGVDKLEVSGNNTTAVGIITQAGSGDILRLYDSTTEVFSVADGGNVTTTGQLNIPDSIVHSGNDNLKLRFPATDTFTVETAGSERFRIGDDGQTTITAASGDSILHIKRSNTNTTGLTGGINFVASDDHSVANIQAIGDGDNEGAHILFKTTSAAAGDIFNAATVERLRIASNGHVGVGTDNPQAPFHIFNTQDSILRLESSDNNAVYHELYRANGGTKTRIGYMGFGGSGATLNITNEVPNGDIFFSTTPNGASAGAEETAFRVYANKTAQVYGDLSIADKIIHTGDTDTAIRFSGADTITAETGGSSRFKIDSSGNVTIGNDGDSGSNPSAGYDELCIEGGNEDIGMCFLSPAANTVKHQISFGDSNNNQAGRIIYDHDGDYMSFWGSNNERLRITSNAKIKVNVPTSKVGITTGSLDVWGDATSYPTIRLGSLDLNEEGEHIRFGRKDISADIRYHSIWGRNSSTSGSNYLAFKLHDGSGSPFTGQAEILRLTGDSRVGINTNAPASTLHVRGGIIARTSGASVRIESDPATNFAQVQLLNGGGNLYIGRENSAGNWFGTGTAYASVVRSDGTHPLIFRWNSADRLKIHNYASVNFVEVASTAQFSLANNGANTRSILIGDANASSTGSMHLQAGGGSTGFGGGIRLYSHANSTNAGGVYIGKSLNSSGSIILGNGGTTPSSTYLEIDDGGRVALGGLDASAYYSSYNQFVIGRTTDTGGMTIVSKNDSSGYIAFADGTSGDQAYKGRMFYNHVDNDLRFNLDGQSYNSMRLHRTGALTNSFDAQSHYTRPLLEITTSATPTQLKITTNIPYSGVTHAHSVRISGFRYGGREMADLQIGWHVYNNQFYNRIASSSGSWAPTITLAVESGKVVIHLTSPGYWPKMYVESMYQAYGDSEQARGWTWADAAISADSNTPNETVPYKSNFGNGVNIDMNGHLYVNNGNIVMGNDKGISFLNADDTATGETVSSSVLDDYEEGTFTATLKGHTDPSNTSSVNANKTTTTTGRYVKVGQSVTVTMRWYNLQNNGANEMHNCQLQNIHGLPYHSNNTSTNWTASLGYQRGLYPRWSSSSVTSQAVWMYGYIEGNSDKVQLRASQSSGPGTLYPTVHDSTTHMYLTFTITYQSLA